MYINKELTNKVTQINDWLETSFGDSSMTQKEIIYGRSVKLNEEVGELMSEVLASFNGRRKEKLEHTHRDNLEKEFGDVMFTTLLLAKSMDVDINEALAKTIDKLEKRKG